MHWKWIVAVAVLLPAVPPEAGVAQAPVVLVIAPSASTRLEAARMLQGCRWPDTTIVRDADLVLVVVRSSGEQPLAPSYDSLRWLREGANSQMNESGAQFHVYLYMIREDLTFLQSSHRSYDANPTGALSAGTAPVSSLPAPATLYPCS